MIIAPGWTPSSLRSTMQNTANACDQPVMEIVIPSCTMPRLAPEGQHVLSAHVMYVPYRRKVAGPMRRVASCANAPSIPLRVTRRGIREQILQREFLTPADLEQNYHVTGGHWHHTEFAMDQLLMMRPTYEAAQYSTPIPGLYLCGAGCHPGGDLTGAPGITRRRRSCDEQLRRHHHRRRP